MTFREYLNKHQSIVFGAVIVVIALAIYTIFQQTTGRRWPAAPTTAFFTVDDGTTWFTESVDKIAPFQKDGKEAVMAHVYSCGDKPFVGYLETNTPALKAELEKFASAGKASHRPEDMQKLMSLQMEGRLVRKPGAKTWTRLASPQGTETLMATCPDGKALTVVQP